MAKKAKAKKDKNTKHISFNNMILAKDLYVSTKAKGDNINVLIIGAAGSGKSFGVIKPNLMQMNTSFVVTDPSGEILRAKGRMLLENGYVVKVFSTSDFAHSNCYNPFDYVYNEDGTISQIRVSSMISMFQQNADAMKKKSGGDPFWDKSANALLTGIALLLLEFCDEADRNFFNVLKLVTAGKVDEGSNSSQTQLDRLFEKCKKTNPEAMCLRFYETFKLAPAKTANSILISAGVDLQKYGIDQVRNMTSTDYKVKKRNRQGRIEEYVKERGKLVRTDENIDLTKIGDRKTAMFVNIPQADSTFNFLVSMMYSQLFDILYGRAEKICPQKWMINNGVNEPLVTMIDSQEKADKLLALYKEAEVCEEFEGDTPLYYIKNDEATKDLSMPGFKPGYLMQVYSKEVGEKILKQFDDKAKVVQGNGTLPYRVQCLLDEFSNIGEIPDFPQKLATMRKYGISCTIVLQSLAQLENRYEKLYADIISNCQYTIFLGTQDQKTCEHISKALGKTTTRTQSRSISHQARGGSSSKSYNLDARDLLAPDEVAKVGAGKQKNNCIIISLGEMPFYAEKYNAAKHPMFPLSGDCDPSRNLSVSEFTTCTEKRTATQNRVTGSLDEQKKAIEEKRDITGKPFPKAATISSVSEMKKALGMRPNDTIANRFTESRERLNKEHTSKLAKDGVTVVSADTAWGDAELLPVDDSLANKDLAGHFFTKPN